MIRYALSCEGGHPFEAWFASSDAYDQQAAQGQVECPFCASRSVRKQIMAPAVATGGRRDDPPHPGATGDPAAAMMELAERVRAHVAANYEHVGDAFAREARAILDGERESQAIYGRATAEEVRALVEEGAPVAPLPAAFTPRRREGTN